MIPFGDLHWSDVKGRPSWRWATVTATSPALALVVDGDDDPIGVPPTVLGHVGPLTVGTRVWCQVTPGGAVVAVGRAGPPLLRPLVLTGGWAHYGPGWAEPTFMVDAAGFVRLDGMVGGGTGAAIATLPVGARPAGNAILTTASSWSDSARRLYVRPTGVIELYEQVAPAWVSLSGLTFPTAR